MERRHDRLAQVALRGGMFDAVAEFPRRRILCQGVEVAAGGPTNRSLGRNTQRTLSLKLSQGEGRDSRDGCHNLHCFSWGFLEATAGIEPACADLQSAA